MQKTQPDWAFRVVSTALGAMTLIADGEALFAARFGKIEGKDDPENEILALAQAELSEYFAGKRRIFTVPLHQTGTPFQLRVWRALLNIGYGQTRCYGEIACALGGKKYSRAVGMANNKNPLPIFVPCHRVIGADGSLTGYASGVDKKAYLLRLEKEHVL